MSKEIPQIEDEILDHKTSLKKWVSSANSMKVLDNQKGVVARFIEDCTRLINYLDEKESPSTADLNDFTARRNSLHTQYLNIRNAVNG